MSGAVLPDRMRVPRGRVLHRVQPILDGTWYASLCRTGRPSTARALAPREDWSTERLGYPDCARCPSEAGPPMTLSEVNRAGYRVASIVLETALAGAEVDEWLARYGADRWRVANRVQAIVRQLARRGAEP